MEVQTDFMEGAMIESADLSTPETEGCKKRQLDIIVFSDELERAVQQRKPEGRKDS
ncbi:hypothetical protein KSP40_PGU009882 [Platanthera guangdongensis]|uniref:Uncharacterized protein n=1 Tax=Platanthera guangdongensis TaxID=2320717 RepID=A0ABR2LEL7_9ASPA